MKQLKLFFYKSRRTFLRNFVPEFIWPKNVMMDNVLIPIRNMPYSFGVKRILCKDEYETNERVLIKQVLKKGDCVLELGGSIGILTSIISEQVGNTGRVVSVEASGRLTEQSKKWIEPMGNVNILTGIGFPVLNVPEKFKNLSFIDEGNSLGGMVDFKSQRKEQSAHQVYDINTVVSNFGITPNVLIVDIEGSEVVLLENDTIIPEYVKHIIMEMHPGLYEHTSVEENIIKKMQDFGFVQVSEVNKVYLLSRNEF